MKLSQHFYLREFTRSQTATRLDIDNTPSQLIIDNLIVLCNDYLEPLRKVLDSSIMISSGYRCVTLNNAIGGSITSSHVNGEAVDMIVVGIKPIAVSRAIRDLDLNYDQNIYEFGEWSHWGIGPKRRKDDLTAYRKNGRVVYASGIHSIKGLRNDN